MYFSRLTLDPRAAVTKSVYDAHQALWRLFSDSPDRRRDFLFREIDPLTYLCVSVRPPVDPDGLWTVSTKPYSPRLAEGDRLFVSLRANAVVKRSAPDGKQVRFDVVQDARMRFKQAGQEPPPRPLLAQQAGLKWLVSRQATMGLCFEDASVVVGAYTQHRLWRFGRKAKVSMLDFSGFAQVSEQDLAMKSLLEGVGPAKGFGCGLVLARRA